MAEVTQDSHGDTWGTEVTPVNPNAAGLYVEASDDDTLNFTVGDIWFEVYGKVADNLPYLGELVAAVFAGRIEQAGTRNRAYGRIELESGPVGVGHVHLPWPWRCRRARRYARYGVIIGGSTDTA